MLDKGKRKLKSWNMPGKFFYNCGPLYWGDIFLTIFYSIYFSHHCTFQITLQHVGPLCAASMYCFLHLSSDLWVLIMLYLFKINNYLNYLIRAKPFILKFTTRQSFLQKVYPKSRVTLMYYRPVLQSWNQFWKSLFWIELK